MTEIWVCPNCGDEFDPTEQEPYWITDSVYIDCPNCGAYMNTDEQFADGWRKKEGE